MRIAHCLLLLLFLLPVACRPTGPARVDPLPAPSLPSSLGPPPTNSVRLDPRIPPIAWFPGGVRDLAYFRGDLSFLLRFLEHSPLPVPPCVAELRPRIDAQYMVTLPSAGPSINVFHGRLNRAAFEACAVAFFAALGREVMVGRQGALSQMTGPSGRDMFVGWVGEEWVLFHDERPLVEAFLQRSGGLSQQSELLGLLAQVAPGAGIWMISTADMTSRLLGVASSGYIATLGEDPARPQIQLQLLFSQPSEAEKAAAGIRRPKSDRLSDAAKLAIASLGPQVVGSQVRVRILPAAFDTAVLRELQQVLEQIQRGEQTPGAAPGASL